MKKVTKIVLVILGVIILGGISTLNKADTDTSTVNEEQSNAQESIVKVTQEEKSDSNKQEEKSKESQVPIEYKNALAKAQIYASEMYMSKKGIHDQLTSEYGEAFSEDAAQYAMNNVKANWNNNALQKAKTYQKTMNMSIAKIKEQLTSEYGERFTPEEAQYAVDNLKK